MIIPQYLKHIADADSIEESTFSLKLEDHKEFEVYYTGVLKTIDDTLYITPDYENKKEDYPILRIMVKGKGSDKLHTIYDGRIYGYNNMFCDQHDSVADYELNQLTVNGSNLFAVTVTLGYGIDYDDEKDDYDVDEQDMAEVMNRPQRISWQQVKEEGYDWLTIQFSSSKGDSVFVDEELA